jgi:opacity protein-like surface antigen
MKKLLVTLAILAMASSAMAITLSIGGGGGILLPLGDFADAVKLGYGFGGGASIGVIPLLNIDVDFGYYLGMKEKTETLLKWKSTMIPITFGASINIIHGGKFVPYAGGGGGFYLMKAKPETGDSVSTNKPGIYFGGGIKYFFTDKIALNVNPKFHVVFVEGAKNMFMTIGGGISYAVM